VGQARKSRFGALGTVFLAASCGLGFAQLETRASMPVTAEAWALGVGDFNGDGALDVAAITVYSTNHLAIMIGNGDGTFGKPTYYTVGSEPPNSVAVADLRNNGKLDLVIGESLTDSVYVLLGNGDGTFQQAVPYATLGRPFLAGVGDFNNDGKPDIWALTNEYRSCGCIEVLLGNGDGTFGAPILTLLATSAFAAASGDFNGDGKLDIVASETFGDSQLEVMLGNGDGTFRRGETYHIDDYATIAVGQFVTGSKNLDLALAEPEVGEIAILLGNGEGSFRQGQVIPGSFPAGISTADFNGDGKPDLVTVAGLDLNQVVTYLGNGDGTFQPGVSFPLGNECVFPATGDFNGDHKIDVVVPNNIGDSVITLLNTGVVAFSPTTPMAFGKQAVGATSAPQTVTLTNTGSATLKISGITVTGQFKMSSTTCHSQVAPAASCSISVTFSPQSQGAKSGLISITDNASSKPQVIELSGTGG